MSEEKGGHSPLFLDEKSIREILQKASSALFFASPEEIVEEAVQLIQSMGEDLNRLSQLSLENFEPFTSHDSLSLNEIDDFYKKLIDKTSKESYVSPHTIN
ncbi:hypothetical protein DNK47_01670 [Mycoplasma wenyonii]|uniref:Uncharacterized protein n=1 Tax=Mycoplasma wenyonii TaxID=65123 RepID=A0A328PPM8_9MOLU|nr:hypothetical protein [Mycoplasma wenyonii]RAO95096.1 hypothetical protein DNK47_01670 [Mycoplasma wenyonii]